MAAIRRSAWGVLGSMVRATRRAVTFLLRLGWRGLRSVLTIVRPTLVLAWWTSRRLGGPGNDAAARQARVQHEIALAHNDVTGLSTEARELVLLSIAQEGERIAALEGKGLAVAALPSALAAVAALIVGRGATATTLAVIALAYCGCALLAASLVLRPRSREVFGLADATASDGLERAVAVTRINQPIGIIINNWVVAAINDTIRAAAVVVAAAIYLLVNAHTGVAAGSGACASTAQSSPITPDSARDQTRAARISHLRACLQHT